MFIYKDNELLLLSIIASLTIPGDKNINSTVDYSKLSYTLKLVVDYYTNNKDEIILLSKNYFNLMSEIEWKEIFWQIKRRSELLSLKITFVVHDFSCGLNAVCYEIDDENAIVVYGGSMGNGWKDNGQGAFQPDTVQQKTALNFLNKLKYKNIIVTGHSKGGNDAQYVALLSQNVIRAVSFDSQGFSDNFVRKYNKEIKERKHKIIDYSSEYDFVHALLYSVAGKEFELDTEYQLLIWENHKPNILLDKNGELKKLGERKLFIDALNIWSMRISVIIPDAYGLDIIDVLFDYTNKTNIVNRILFLQGCLIILPLLLDESLIQMMILVDANQIDKYIKNKNILFNELYTLARETINELEKTGKGTEKIGVQIAENIPVFLQSIFL